MGCRRQGVSGSEPSDNTLVDPQTLSDRELLAALLAGSNCRESTPPDRDLAGDLLEQYGDLLGLAKTRGGFIPPQDREALFPLAMAFEVACRLAKAKIPARKLMDRPDAVAGYLTLRYGMPDQESMGALFLDVRNRLIAEGEMFRGTLARAVVEPRAILRKALLCSAAGVALFHFHPSTDPTPSQEDVLFTERMVESGKLLGIRIIDHLVLGSRGRWVSLARLGFINPEP